MRRRELPTRCEVCKRELALRERPEGVCDECLRAHDYMLVRQAT